ncbi:MAG TPA: TonB-dependent receptor [Usitatibacteraceae bacterium]|nr:TonB-dependent receptor [Usitatibacteraceae bacterium]HRA24521.1 TonB-dependent receptor [Usitatibacteraceae bacterium]
MSQSTRLAGAVASALLAFRPALAQEPQPSNPQPAEAVEKVDSVVVTASPLGRPETELAQPASVLSGDELRRARAASIGDTLSGLPGVQSSAFGPAAGRPVIRGLDGPRVRVLENGVGTLDVSTLSPDHAVATEPLFARRIEVLRGPASLLYGSGAIGGVVNVVTSLVPDFLPAAPTGAVELRAGSADRERSAAAELTGGAGTLAWHLEGFSRDARDYRIPGRTDRDDGEGPSGRLASSFIDARGGGAGLSWVGGLGHAGLGVSRLESDYGIPSGEGISIALRQTRWQAASDLDAPWPGIASLRLRAGFNDYEHREIESGGEVGTVFANRAGEARLELGHAPWRDGKGVLGLHVTDRDFSAEGEEVVVPRTRSKGAAVFLVEERRFGRWTLDAGARWERETHRPEGGAPSRRFGVGTLSAGAVWEPAAGWRASASLTRAERAPAAEELYSDGPHGATQSYEVGDPGLRKEVSRNLDVTLRRTGGALRWTLTAFASRVRDHIHAASRDADGDGVADRVDDEGELAAGGELLFQQFTQADARFHGLEAELRWQPAGSPWSMRLFGDRVRGRLVEGGDLPRIPPSRFGASFEARAGAWSGWLTATRIAAQERVAALETPTPGATKVDAGVAWSWRGDARRTLVAYLQGTNLGDREIRPHASYLKDVAPLRGRSFVAGVRAEF